MALPRSKFVSNDSIGIYHCFCRCVRRAFLCGFDSVSGRDFSHRKSWIQNRLQFLSSIFAIDVFNYSILDNHYHLILRTRPDIANSWSNYEVARRWLSLCPNRYRSTKKSPPPLHLQISALANSPVRIAQLRLRLCNLSWFMKHSNEFIARAANREDNVKGRFWESRFKSQTLLDYPAILACMVYVDLNPIRARIASSPASSNFTSIQQRIRSWNSRQPHPWLCPIDLESGGILRLSPQEYFLLVDQSGRILQSNKSTATPPPIAPLLMRLGSNPLSWPHTIANFGSSFRLAAGSPSKLHSLAHQLGKKWFVGINAARSAFL